MIANDLHLNKRDGFEKFETLLENEFEHVGGTKATKLGSYIKEIIGDAVEKKYSSDFSKLKEETWKEFLSNDVKSIGYEKVKRTLSGASFSTGPKVKSNFLDKIGPDGVSQHMSVVLAIYYTAHISEDNNLNEAAERVDLAFFGKTFEKKFGRHVPTSKSEGNSLIDVNQPRQVRTRKNHARIQKLNQFVRPISFISVAIVTVIFAVFYYYENYVIQPENPIEVNAVGSASYEQAKLHRAKDENYKQFEALLEANDDDYAPARAALAVTYLHGVGTVKNPEFAKVTAQSALDLGLVEMSENNNKDALYQLALLHRDGLAVEKSTEKYKNLMTKAAALGHSRAAHYLGKMLYEHEDQEERCRGLEFTEQAAKKGQIEAAHWLGWYYKEGKCGSPDLVKAVEAFKLAANGGNSGSQLDLGYLYETGQGVPNPSISNAEKWYLKAANQGSAQAQFNLGNLYYYKKIYVEDPYKEAFKWYDLAAKQGHANAENDLGYLYEKGLGVDQDYGQALDWYERSANQNLHRAQHNLAGLYKNLHRSDGAFPNYKKAKEWYEKAAEGGYVAAQIDLANFYIAGNDQAEPDYKSAVIWLQKAAESGSAKGQVELGKLYEHGQGVKQSSKIAFDLYKKAADQEYSYAYSFVADMYKNGLGVDRDIDKAIDFYQKGVSKNDRNSMLKLALIYLYENPDDDKYTEALTLLHRAVEEKNGYAAIALAEIYARGKFGVKKNVNKVLELISKGTSKEGLGYTYLVFADLMTAISTKESRPDGLEKIFEAAIRHGSAEASTAYGWALLSGSVFEKNVVLAKEYFQKASVLGQNSAYAGLGFIELENQSSTNLQKSYTLCHKASDAGEQCGDYCLGLIYFKQLAADSNIISASEAEKALTRSAKLGNSCSMLLLGVGYELNYFESNKPLEQALHWLRKASDTGSLDASFNLGMFLIRTKHQRFEPGFEAYELINNAASEGHKISQCAYVAFQAIKDRVDVKLYKLSGYLKNLKNSGILSESQAEMVLQDPRTASEIAGVRELSERVFQHPNLSKGTNLSGIRVVE